MLTRFFLMISLLFVVAACSSTDDEALTDEVPVFEREAITTAGTPGVNDGSLLAGPTPGSQEDLVETVGDRVFYDYDSSVLSAPARETLLEQSKWLARYPSLQITIEGHCDERGTREYNLALGERRATAARDYLVALGVSASRITTVSFGKERPAVPGANPTAWSQNRRAVTVVE